MRRFRSVTRRRCWITGCSRRMQIAGERRKGAGPAEERDAGTIKVDWDAVVGKRSCGTIGLLVVECCRREAGNRGLWP